MLAEWLRRMCPGRAAVTGMSAVSSQRMEMDISAGVQIFSWVSPRACGVLLENAGPQSPKARGGFGVVASVEGTVNPKGNQP